MRFKLLIILLPFLFSCSAIFVSNRNVRFNKPTETDKVEVRAFSRGTTVIESKNKTFKLRNKEKGYIVDVKRAKHRSKSTVIMPTKFNYLKIIDVLIPLAADVFLFTANDDVSGKIRGSVFMVGLFGWIGPFVGPWKLYDKSYSLPEPLPLPQREKNQAFIQNIDYRTTIPKENRKSYEYSNYKGFLSQTIIKKQNFKDSLNTKPYSFDNYELKVLDVFKLKDTNETFYLNKLSDLKLNVTVKSLEEHSIHEAKKVIASVELSLLNNFNQNSLVKKEVEATSNWSRFYSFQEGLNVNQRNDVIEDALAQFLKDVEVQHVLTNYKSQQAVNNPEANKKTILNSNTVKSLPEAVKAVVTIITKDGYGSGCIVSNDGYITTNSHVIANNDASIIVQLNDSTQHKATIIVANLKEDLALLKIEAALDYAFGIDKLLPIEVGQEVYAIGASNIDDYSMSVSKGIISTIRKVDGQTFIQTDGSINRGNSGGALINKEGKLYGIITAKMIGDGIEGVGFVIPYTKLEEALSIKFE